MTKKAIAKMESIAKALDGLMLDASLPEKAKLLIQAAAYRLEMAKRYAEGDPTAEIETGDIRCPYLSQQLDPD